MQKIMFNDAYGLTQATIEGRKTMTRRILNPQPTDCSEFHKHYAGAEWENEPMKLVYDPNMKGFYCKYCGNGVNWDGDPFIKAAYQVGEVVAVAQRYADIPDAANMADTPGWRNKMFVKAELMPHRIRITGIRAERLQDISDEDCIKEGIVYAPDPPFDVYGVPCTTGMICLRSRPRETFAALIDKVSGRGTWARNPWVVAYEYELVK